MAVTIEQLLACGAIKLRCREPVRVSCSGCGTTFSESEWRDNGSTCPLCGTSACSPVCMTCGQKLEIFPVSNAERNCFSRKLFEETGRIVFPYEFPATPPPPPVPPPETVAPLSTASPTSFYPEPLSPGATRYAPLEKLTSDHMVAKVWDIIETMEGQDVTIGKVIHLAWDFGEPAKFFRISHYHGTNPCYPTTPVIFGVPANNPFVVSPPRQGQLWLVTGEEVTFKLSARLLSKKWFAEKLTVPFTPARLCHNSVILNRRTIRLIKPLQMLTAHIPLRAAIKPLHQELPFNRHIPPLSDELPMQQAVLPVQHKQELIDFAEVPLCTDVICMQNSARPADGWRSVLTNNPVAGWIQTKIFRKERV